MTTSNTSDRIFYRALPHGILRLGKWIRENRRPLHELLVTLLLIGLTIPIFVVTDLAEKLYIYSRAHEGWQLDEIVLSLAAASFFLAIFATRQWVDAIVFLHRSNTDSLTGLTNRRKGWEVLEQEMQRARRYQRPLSLIMFDIDSYKEFNESLGHQTGDMVLKKVAKSVQSELRASDTLVRWGGDEFIIICVESDLPTALQLAERLRATIDQNPVQGLWNTTASFGVAQFEKEDDFNSLMRRVDDRLYVAKTQGKNQVA